MNLSSQMLFTLAMFRDRPDGLIWHSEPPFTTCLFGCVPFIEVPRPTICALAARGLIEEATPGLMTLTDAGSRAVVGHPKVYDHAEAVIALRARQIVHDAIKRATKGTRRKPPA